MQFVKCPFCGMKNVSSVNICKGCQKPIESAEIVELKGYVAPKKKDDAGIIRASENDSLFKPLKNNVAEKKPDVQAGAELKDNNYDNLIENAFNNAEHNTGAAEEEIEIVREKDAETESETETELDNNSKNNIQVTKNSDGLRHIKIIEKQDPNSREANNFQRNIVPRLLQIFLALFLIAIIALGITIYNIMDLPQYYNYFHMRMETTKSFAEALVQLNVCENARRNAKLNFQVGEIEGGFKNRYFMWKMIVSKIDRITSDPLSKNVYLLTVTSDRASKATHLIRMYANDKMAAKMKKSPLKLSGEKSMTLHGRIIGWFRSKDAQSIEIEAYDAEFLEGY